MALKISGLIITGIILESWNLVYRVLIGKCFSLNRVINWKEIIVEFNTVSKFEQKPDTKISPIFRINCTIEQWFNYWEFMY
jgi:hypothetical protein